MRCLLFFWKNFFSSLFFLKERGDLNYHVTLSRRKEKTCECVAQSMFGQSRSVAASKETKMMYKKFFLPEWNRMRYTRLPDFTQLPFRTTFLSLFSDVQVMASRLIFQSRCVSFLIVFNRFWPKIKDRRWHWRRLCSIVCYCNMIVSSTLVRNVWCSKMMADRLICSVLESTRDRRKRKGLFFSNRWK